MTSPLRRSKNLIQKILHIINGKSVLINNFLISHDVTHKYACAHDDINENLC